MISRLSSIVSELRNVCCSLDIRSDRPRIVHIDPDPCLVLLYVSIFILGPIDAIIDKFPPYLRSLNQPISLPNDIIRQLASLRRLMKMPAMLYLHKSRPFDDDSRLNIVPRCFRTILNLV